MFYKPNREQAIQIQKTLEEVYKEAEGEFYSGDEAWNYLYCVTGIDLHSILHEIAFKKRG